MPARKKPEAASVAGLKGRTATINDIARLSGVSKKTVSRIINHSPLVRQDTREKVEALMREVGYTPDPMARGLAFRRSFLIGMVYDNPTAQYVVDMQYGALDALRGSGFELVVHPCDSRSPGYIEGVRRFVQQQKLHGVILVPRASEDQALADMLAGIGCRYTRIAAVALDATSQMVITHDREGAAEAADYLLSLGHRDIALITGPSAYRSSHERTGGIVDALRQRGLELAPERIVEAGYTFESGVAAAEKLLAGPSPRPSAIFTGNDEMAAGVYRVAMRLGIAIPRQLSVIGYDDSPLASRLWPPLTSVRRQTRDTGRTAAAMLIQPDSAQVLAVASVRPHLIVRDSCQPPES
ncbi:LacI family DNA-binding transcriptional regulator [Stenotrophomonas sp. MMGLT7]|uniref:LacI family DNA-binding transcriptional regulator n=1 Tax=Stenotrophomonas sp. MMGLT7 TaxID=2901227 RepID=UPI001E2E0588|nr:LacI family DNA-binding transcriptional regulator [Stenotrophomonas sp. MMGLT7]MCD7098557.1 LacI family DNA-binding transcriptional regulator [Stenotrophomonas sp. MMGLT7]